MHPSVFSDKDFMALNKNEDDNFTTKPVVNVVTSETTATVTISKVLPRATVKAHHPTNQPLRANKIPSTTIQKLSSTSIKKRSKEW